MTDLEALDVLGHSLAALAVEAKALGRTVEALAGAVDKIKQAAAEAAAVEVVRPRQPLQPKESRSLEVPTVVA